MEQINQEVLYGILFSSIAFCIMAFFAVLITIRFIKRKNNLERENLAQREAFEKNLLQAQIEIKEETLKTISQEIHDNIGQQLSVSKFTLNTIGTTGNNTVDEKIDDCKNSIGKIIQELRDLAKSINNDSIEKKGLVNTVQHEISTLNKLGIDAVLEVTGLATTFNAQVELILFRIIQESINNAIKHAKASKLKINLNYSGNKLEILIEDNGVGFDTEVTNAQTADGIGLSNMQNRCKIIEAALAIESTVGKGTQVKITTKY